MRMLKPHELAVRIELESTPAGLCFNGKVSLQMAAQAEEPLLGTLLPEVREAYMGQLMIYLSLRYGCVGDSAPRRHIA